MTSYERQGDPSAFEPVTPSINVRIWCTRVHTHIRTHMHTDPYTHVCLRGSHTTGTWITRDMSHRGKRRERTGVGDNPVCPEGVPGSLVFHRHHWHLPTLCPHRNAKPRQDPLMRTRRVPWVPPSFFTRPLSRSLPHFTPVPVRPSLPPLPPENPRERETERIGDESGPLPQF